MRSVRWIAVLLVFVLCLGVFVGCKRSDTAQGTTTVPTTAPVTQPATEPVTEPTTEPTTAPTEPPMDAQTLLDKMKAQEDPVPTKVEFLLRVVASTDMQEYGMSMDVGVEASGGYWYVPDPFQLYAQLELDLSSMGEDERLEIVLYGMPDGERKLFYLGLPELEIWGKFHEEELSQLLGSLIAEEGAPESTIEWLEPVLQEELVDYNGTACYVLTLRPDVDQAMKESMEEAMENLLQEEELLVDDELMEQLGKVMELDRSMLQMPITLYVEDSTFLLRGAALEFQGLAEYLTSVINAVEEEPQEQNMFESLEFCVELKNIEYGTVEVPQISEEDRKLADEQNYDPEQEDGSYIIKEDDVAFRLVLPEGWKLEQAYKSSISMICGKEDAVLVNCNIWAGDDSDASDLKTLVDAYAGYYASYYEMEVTSGYGESIDGNETMFYACDEIYTYMMRIPCEGGFLQIEVQNTDATDPYVYLQQIAACIEAVELSG